MTTLIVAAIFSLMLGGLACRADARFRHEDRLPMQWWITGEVTWSAPRRLALAFIPAVAIATLVVFVIMSLTVPPRAGQEGLVIPTLAGLGTMFIAIQLMHFWLIAKTLRRKTG
ncbi:hypothetical protein [Sphingomonas mollis]|uniref:Uncharacterized protein n=1 Tax=Sphingomonas mollis TaxID=2795726 RepID=A0ABS0XJK9_9SPHN|nr:hypothetical protein [Sphingomonas sp. BT553]MBJ6120217.1 hypothetical protein [Sphingomonas sp. BT553]